MSRGVLLTLHLLAAVAFAGTVFVEVVLLGALRGRLPAAQVRAVEQALADRAVRVMPWVLLVLYAAGLALAWPYLPLLRTAPAGGFALLLAIKIALAASVAGHFATAMVWRRRGTFTGRRSRRLHASVFAHVLAIVVLAKAMFAVG